MDFVVKCDAQLVFSDSMTFFLVIAGVIKRYGVFWDMLSLDFRNPSRCRMKNTLDHLAYVLSHPWNMWVINLQTKRSEKKRKNVFRFPEERDPSGLFVEMREKQVVSCLGNGTWKGIKNPACLIPAWDQQSSGLRPGTLNSAVTQKTSLAVVKSTGEMA